MSTRHIARSGQKAGQWVPCSAKTACRNGGTHVSPEDLHAARELHQQETGETVSLTKVPLTAVISFATATDEEKKNIHDAVSKNREEATAKREAKAQAKCDADEEMGRAVRDTIRELREAEEQRMAADPKLLAGQVISEVNNLWRPTADPEDPISFTHAEKARLTKLSRNLSLNEVEEQAFYMVTSVAARHRRLRKMELSEKGLGREGFAAFTRMINLAKAASMVQEKPGSKIYQKLFRDELAETVMMGATLRDLYKEREEAQAARKRRATLGKKILNLFWRTD